MRFPGECNRCGECCRVILTGIPKSQFAVSGSETNAESAAFIMKHWRRISRQEAVRRVPSFDTAGELYVYECDALDRETNRCSVYEDRPPVCSGWPHYHAKRRTTLNVGQCPSCVFNGRTAIPNKPRRATCPT